MIGCPRILAILLPGALFAPAWHRRPWHPYTGRCMPNATAVADRIESELAPLTTEVCHAWWDLNVVANEENEQRRVELETALSDFLADSERFAAIETAREGAEGPARRRLDLLHNVFLPQQTPAELRSRIIELEASVEMRFSQHRGDIDGPARQRQRDPPDPARQRRRRRAACGLGGLEDGRSRGRRGCPRARPAAQCRRALARLPGLVRALRRDVRDGRGQAHGHARRRRPRHGRAVRALEGASSTSGSRPASAAPSTSSRRGTTPTRSSRRSRPRAASTSTRSSRTPIWSRSPGAPTTASGSRRAP